MILMAASGCAKHDGADVEIGAQQATTRTATPTAGPQATGAPLGSGHDEARPGPVGDDNKGDDKTALASPITIPAIQQNGLPVDPSQIYGQGVIQYVEQRISEQCPDQSLCGFSVIAARQEPEPAPEASEVHDYCAFVPTAEQANEVTVTEPVQITLNCVWHYKPAGEGGVGDSDGTTDDTDSTGSSDTESGESSSSESSSGPGDSSDTSEPADQPATQ
jgi:hypothetical protein